MSYLSIDLWNRRCWIAISSQNIAFAHTSIVRTEIISWLKKYLRSNDFITTIIVGLPYDLYGKNTTQLERTQKFIEKLKNIFPGIEVIWHDERFSSFEASQGFDDHRDDIAAQCILQSYLDTLSK